MELPVWILILISFAELVLFGLLLVFFNRLKRSEGLLVKLQEGQDRLMENLARNAELERDMVASFAERQAELSHLDRRLEERADSLAKLLEQAENVSRSPHFLRELIRTGAAKGRSPAQLAKSTGLSLDEVELLLAEPGSPPK